MIGVAPSNALGACSCQQHIQDVRPFVPYSCCYSRGTPREGRGEGADVEARRGEPHAAGWAVS